MPRNEFLYFTKIGMFLERADNTARILDLSFSLNEMENKWESIRDEPLWGKKGLAPDDSVDRLGKIIILVIRFTVFICIRNI